MEFGPPELRSLKVVLSILSLSMNLKSAMFACLDTALPTLVDEYVERVRALLALIRAPSSPLPLVSARVVFHQTKGLLFHTMG